MDFDTLRRANTLRLPQFRNKHGKLAHSQPDGSDWSPAQWLQAVVGELGEYANICKKYERGDIDRDEFAEAAAKELADVQTYLDILAKRCLDRPDVNYVDADGIDLGEVTRQKFNEVSQRVGADVFIHYEDWEFCQAFVKHNKLVSEFMASPFEVNSEVSKKCEAARAELEVAFDALVKAMPDSPLVNAYRNLCRTPIVDDDYPEMRFYFDRELHAVLGDSND